MTPTLTLPPFGYRLVVNPSGGNASARIRPCHTGAETAPLRENHLSRHLRPFPARPSQLGWPPRGGAGSARPQGRHGPHRGMCLVGHRPFGYARGGNEMPGHPDGRTTRTHRVRPSEKTAPTVIPGFAPLGRPSSDGHPAEGAGSARPQSRNWLGLGIYPQGPLAHGTSMGKRSPHLDVLEKPWDEGFGSV
jgi:hypothetical protein